MITAFAAIDEAMLRVVKASIELDAAQYSRGERLARDGLISAAHKLRKVFLSTEKEIKMNIQEKNTATPILPSDGVQLINGNQYMRDAKGSLVPLELVKPADKLEDETVRKVIGHAFDLSDRITRFRGHTMTDLGEFDALLAQEYKVKKGGKKGNRTYQTFDGLQKVVVQVQDTVDFGPQLQQAKNLLDECMNEWAADARPEIQAIITRAFNTDKEGKVNRSEIFMLLRLDINDARWLEAMRAIREAMRVSCSKEYVRFYTRNNAEDPWQAISINIAAV